MSNKTTLFYNMYKVLLKFNFEKEMKFESHESLCFI
jgi:hypothetical protein